jgi:hypothetical protein
MEVLMQRSDIPPLELDRVLDAIPDPARRADAKRLAELMAEVTAQPAALWGGSILGFGSRHDRYDSGREGDTVAVGFAARAANLVIYTTGPLDDDADLLERLGRHRAGKGCLYLRRLSDADEGVLRELIGRSYRRAGTP